MQQAQATLLEEMGNDVGFNDVTNRTYQTIREIANMATGEGRVTKAQADLAIQQLLGTEPITAILNEMRALAAADVQSEIEEGKVKGRQVKGKKDAQKAQAALKEETKPPDLPPFEPIVARIDNNMGPEYKIAIQARLAAISKAVTDLKSKILKLTKQIDGLDPKAEGESLFIRMQKLAEQYADLQALHHGVLGHGERTRAAVVGFCLGQLLDHHRDRGDIGPADRRHWPGDRLPAGAPELRR